MSPMQNRTAIDTATARAGFDFMPRISTANNAPVQVPRLALAPGRHPGRSRRWPAPGAPLLRRRTLRRPSRRHMGEQYARTLREWRARFLAATDDIGQLGFGRAFQRMRDLYLAYSEAGFRSG